MSNPNWDSESAKTSLAPWVAELRDQAAAVGIGAGLEIARGSRTMSLSPWEREILVGFDQVPPESRPDWMEPVVRVNALVFRMIDDFARLDAMPRTSMEPLSPTHRELQGLTRARFRENVELGTAALADLRTRISRANSEGDAALEPHLSAIRGRLRELLAETEAAVDRGGESPAIGSSAAPPRRTLGAPVPSDSSASPGASLRAGRPDRRLLVALGVSALLVAAWYGWRLLPERTAPVVPVALADFAAVPEVVALETVPPDAKIRINDSWRKLPKADRKELLLRIGAVLEPRGFRKAEVAIVDTPDQVVGRWFAGGGLSFERFD